MLDLSQESGSIPALYARHAGPLTEALRRYGYPEDVAQDAVQEVFERLLREDGRGDQEEELTFNLLLGRARSRAHSLRRSQARRQQRQSAAAPGIHAKESLDPEAQAHLQDVKEAMAKLPTGPQRALRLAAQGYTGGETAKMSEVSPATASRWLRSGRETLRQELRDSRPTSLLVILLAWLAWPRRAWARWVPLKATAALGIAGAGVAGGAVVMGAYQMGRSEGAGLPQNNEDTVLSEATEGIAETVVAAPPAPPEEGSATDSETDSGDESGGDSETDSGDDSGERDGTSEATEPKKKDAQAPSKDRSKNPIGSKDKKNRKPKTSSEGQAQPPPVTPPPRTPIPGARRSGQTRPPTKPGGSGVPSPFGGDPNAWKKPKGSSGF